MIDWKPKGNFLRQWYQVKRWQKKFVQKLRMRKSAFKKDLQALSLAGEIAKISARSQNLGHQKLAEILGEILKSRRDSRRDLGEILKSRRPKTRRDSRRDSRSQNLSSKKLAENLDKISSKILARSQSLGGQNLAENLCKTSSKARSSLATQA